MASLEVGAAHVARAKRAFSTRRVPPGRMATLLRGRLHPAPGDLVLARVDEIGKQTKIELTDGRRAHLFPGDQIVVSFGNRYAPDQYEAVIGLDLSPCDLVAAGGIAGVEVSRHQRMLRPTKITPIGLIGNEVGERLNLMQFRVDAEDHFPSIPAILSLGTSMNAGKTLTATSMVRGLKHAGFKVAALKITGTGAGGDMWIVRDAGADVALDFTDAGFATTYLASIADIERATFRLLNHAASLGCEIAVIEIADGLQQLETAQLICSDAIRNVAIGTVFAAYDAMGAKCGIDVLREAGHDVLAISGRLGRSPLAVREAEAATGLRVHSPMELQEGVLVPAIQKRIAARADVSDIRAHRTGSVQLSAREPVAAPTELLIDDAAGSTDAAGTSPEAGRIIELPYRARAAAQPSPAASSRSVAGWTCADIVRFCAPARQRLELWAGWPLALSVTALKSSPWAASIGPARTRLARRVAAMRTQFGEWRKTDAEMFAARALGTVLVLPRWTARMVPLRLIPEPEDILPGKPMIAMPSAPPSILSGLPARPATDWGAAQGSLLGQAIGNPDSWSAIARDFEREDESREAMQHVPVGGKLGGGDLDDDLDDDESDAPGPSTRDLFQPPHAVAGE